jgi:hypothetical protein
LGADGGGHHGGLDCGHRAHSVGAAGDVCGLVSGEALIFKLFWQVAGILSARSAI